VWVHDDGGGRIARRKAASVVDRVMGGDDDVNGDVVLEWWSR